jgi:hypothetical protein
LIEICGNSEREEVNVGVGHKRQAQWKQARNCSDNKDFSGAQH